MAAPKKPQDHKLTNGEVEYKGVRVTVPSERASDWDVIEGLATMQDDSASTSEKLVASVRVMRRLFGSDYERVKTELRAANAGVLTHQDMASFINEVLGAHNPNS